jgi:hypothetical protein
VEQEAKSRHHRLISDPQQGRILDAMKHVTVPLRDCQNVAASEDLLAYP